jgi:membrane fusion protein (multidrug efflux system)
LINSRRLGADVRSLLLSPSSLGAQQARAAGRAGQGRAVEQQAELDLTRIVAPIDGVVDNRNLRVGGYAADGPGGCRLYHGQFRGDGAPASGADFTLLPPDNATGNFTKIVQRIPVKTVLDRADPPAGKVRPRMSVVATVDTRPRDAGDAVPRSVRRPRH